MVFTRMLLGKDHDCMGCLLDDSKEKNCFTQRVLGFSGSFCLGMM